MLQLLRPFYETKQVTIRLRDANCTQHRHFIQPVVMEHPSEPIELKEHKELCNLYADPISLMIQALDRQFGDDRFDARFDRC